MLEFLLNLLPLEIFAGFVVIVVGIVLLIVVFWVLGKFIGYTLWLRRVWRAKLGWGESVKELARRLKLEARDLLEFEPGYRTHFIKKRTGGERRLAIPNDATKQLQRTILRRLLAKLRAHAAATGFERGKSIVHNALPHVGRAVVLKFDLVDFFPTTTAERVDWYFRMSGWNAKAAAVLTKLTTLDGGLPQGAPTSPRLSNLINHLLDVQLTKLAERRHGTYTRYADDLTFSFAKIRPKRMRGICQAVKRLVNRHGYRLQQKKSHVLRRHQRQMVTGLVVNAKVQLSRARRRQLRAVEHRLRTNQRATMTPEQLAGWQALQKMIQSQVAAAAAETARKTAAKPSAG